MTLKIEAGKRYVTADGAVFGPMTDRRGDSDYAGLFVWSSGARTWREDGSYDLPGWPSIAFDLVAEYVEPAAVESPIDDEVLTQTTCPLEMLRTPGAQDDKSERLQQFDAEITTVTQRRGAVYGHPRVDFDRAARLKAVVSECADPIARHALEMIAVKMARLIETPGHLDSWVDIAGYARTGVMGTDRP